MNSRSFSGSSERQGGIGARTCTKFVPDHFKVMILAFSFFTSKG